MLLNSIARAGDVVGRLGGDEFALFIPSAPTGTGDDMARRIRHAAASFDTDALTSGLSLSTGVATTGPDESPNIDALLARADRAMYHARSTRGRRDAAASPSR